MAVYGKRAAVHPSIHGARAWRSEEAMLLKGRMVPYTTRQQTERTQNMGWNPRRCRRALARQPPPLLLY